MWTLAAGDVAQLRGAVGVQARASDPQGRLFPSPPGRTLLPSLQHPWVSSGDSTPLETDGRDSGPRPRALDGGVAVSLMNWLQRLLWHPCPSSHFLSVPTPPSHPGGAVRQAEAGWAGSRPEDQPLLSEERAIFRKLWPGPRHCVQMSGRWGWREIRQNAGPGNGPGASTLARKTPKALFCVSGLPAQGLSEDSSSEEAGTRRRGRVQHLAREAVLGCPCGQGLSGALRLPRFPSQAGQGTSPTAQESQTFLFS